MESEISPRLRRSDVVLNGITSCITNTSEKLSRTPEMSFCEILPQPGMFMQQFEGTVSLEQLQSSTNTHSWGQLNKQVDMVNSNMQLIDFTPIFPSGSVQDSLAINSNTEKLKGVFGVLRFPDKMESILSEGMFPGFKVHFFPPANLTGNPAHAKFAKFISGAQHQSLSYANNFKELNLGDGNSSLGFKAQVSLPFM